MMQVYLAGAIDRSKQNPKKWTEEVTKELLSAWEDTNTDDPSCLIVYAPALAYTVTGEIQKKDTRGIVIPNMGALECSDAVVCRYDPGVETWGTPMEVMWANRRMNLPVFVWTTEGLSPSGEIHAWSILPTYLTHFAQNEMCYVSASSVAQVVVQHLREIEHTKSDNVVVGQEIEDFMGMLRGLQQ